MKKLVLSVIALLFLSFGTTTPYTDPLTESSTVEVAGVDVGDKAPNFNLKNIDGNYYSLDNIKDAQGRAPKGYILVFTCNTCPYAQANEQRLIALHQAYGPNGYPVVAIQPNDPALKPGDSFAAMKRNAKQKEFPFLYLLDHAQEVFPKYGATKTPEVFLVDADRVVRYHGAIDDSPRSEDGVSEKFVEDAIKAIDSGKDPATLRTKAVGCGIKSSRA